MMMKQWRLENNDLTILFYQFLLFPLCHVFEMFLVSLAMTNNCLLFCLLFTGLVSGDNIEPDKEKNVITEERGTVKLSCSYSTTSNNVLLYWYRQYPNREPQYLLHKAPQWSDAQTSDRRFQSTTSGTSTELTITDVRLSDSALYYCALRVVAQ